MKLLINTTTLKGTGVTQVALSFLLECKKIHENEYVVFLSSTLKNEIKEEEFPKNFKFYSFQEFPQNLLSGYFLRKKLRKLADDLNPDVVFSVFGPSYWTPRKPHLQGYAFPHYIYEESPFFEKMSWKDWGIYKVYKLLHRFFLNRNGNYFVSETEDVSNRAIRFLNIKPENMFTVSNTFSEHYSMFRASSNLLLPKNNNNEFRILSLCSFAPHKNLDILNEVIPKLKEKSTIKFNFILTVDTVTLVEKLNPEVMDSIINLGRISVADCAQLYYETNALFLPTLLECFTANYPEAMIMKKPILTSNLSFAKTICGDAALYFDPLNAEEIANCIILLATNQPLQNDLVENGLKRLNTFNSPSERAKSYLNILDKIE